MKTADLQIEQDYAYQRYDWENPRRVRVMATGVEYKSTNKDSRIYSVTTKTGGVLCMEIDEDGNPRIAPRVVYRHPDHTNIPEGEPITLIARPGQIKHGWDDELEHLEEAQTRAAQARERREERQRRFEMLVAQFNTGVSEDKPFNNGHLTISDYDAVRERSLGITGVKLSLDQLEYVLDRLES